MWNLCKRTAHCEKISPLTKYQRPKLNIRRATSLDIILKIPHKIFCANRMISTGRILPAFCEYLQLSPQLRSCHKLLESLDIIRDLQLIHSNCINHELCSEPSFPAPQVYLLRYTLCLHFHIGFEHET